ncbi:MAG TPA: TetR/AcrR family transcriptional regulator [Terriglobales bacterium]|nr:TetR/AcrR family transcriptional regulator [Terriglobales bacterium]
MRQDARSSQARLRAAARRLFAQRGYEATSISDIIRAAGTSHSQFLKYYSGKEELRREIVEEQWAELTRAVVLAMTSLPSASGKLRLALNMLVNFLDQDPEFRAILLLEQTAVHENGKVVISNQFLEFIAVLDDIIVEMKTVGEMKDGVDPQALRSALMGSIEGMMRDQMLAAFEFPARYSVEQVRATVSFLIEAACDVQRPSSEALPAALGEAAPGSEDDWIRYYLKLADKVLVQ